MVVDWAVLHLISSILRDFDVGPTRVLRYRVGTWGTICVDTSAWRRWDDFFCLSRQRQPNEVVDCWDEVFLYITRRILVEADSTLIFVHVTLCWSPVIQPILGLPRFSSSDCDSTQLESTVSLSSRKNTACWNHTFTWWQWKIEIV